MPNIPPPSGLYRQDNSSSYNNNRNNNNYSSSSSSSTASRGISAFQRQHNADQPSSSYNNNNNRRGVGDRGERGDRGGERGSYQSYDSHKRNYNEYNDDHHQHDSYSSSSYKKNKMDHHYSSSSYENQSSQSYNKPNSNGFSLGNSNVSFPTILPSFLSKDAINALMARIRLNEINEQGVQNNGFSSLEQYEKHKLYTEVQKLVALAKLINPLFSFENHFVYVKQFISECEMSMADSLDQDGTDGKQINRKIYIPVDEYPDYNFIGLIIGPGGLTQKKLEKESGAKIAVRGKGSVKPGKIPTKSFADEENLHVLITADDEDSVEKAAEMIKRLLIPVEEGSNELKKEQLRELARQRGFTIEGMSDAELGVVAEEGGESAFLAKLQSYGLNQHMPDQPTIPGVTSNVEIPGITDNKKYNKNMESAMDKLKRDLLGGEDNENKQEEENEEIVIEAPKLTTPSSAPFDDAYQQTYDLYYDYYKQFFARQVETFQKFEDILRGYDGQLPKNDMNTAFQVVVMAVNDIVPPIPGEK
ncbi:predicted protein [Naegleria gruberi]|uniref:Branchpoint-bridging protein n=1 Tax=Naegleria gruberi TaxID=5762 RepID=D2VV13_NAEGR|nr:uncharacterized protein NAEGRDRAFT_52482 [Naegleria gruberi]EFC39360.1 predicted protein [Naegleria gruberi]|eukprot:XP_002672104.1 predicted protein [Naegleria gruberi strain NEG-M]